VTETVFLAVAHQKGRIKMKKWHIWSLLVACVLFTSFCLSAPQAEAQALKIGAIFSVTGKARDLGEPERNTVMMLSEEINKAGGVNGFPLQVLTVDDETFDTRAVQEAKGLIETEKVLAIIGPTISGISMKVKPLCEEAKVPMVSCAAAQAIVTPPESSRYTFKTPQLDSHVAVRILEYIKSRGINKIAILSEGTPFGEQGAKQIGDHAKDAGIEVVAAETYKITDTNMKAQLRKIRDSGAAAIINWAMVPTQTLVPKNMKELGIKLPLFASHGFANPKYAETAGAAGEGMILPAGLLLVADALRDDHPQKKILMAYKTAYEKRFGSRASTFGGHAYDAFWLVVNAMRAKGVTPTMEVAKARELIRDGIEETRGWMGTAGVFNMSPNDYTGLDKDKSLGLITVKGGKFAPLAP
jgi:branched-chain amino acid transport system substrate-binding protein